VVSQNALSANPCALSVIIPVLDEADLLASLLTQLAAQSFSSMEIIVVDVGATVAVAKVCAARNVQHLRSAPGRGVQLRAGAARARGSILWFLHADARIDPRAVTELQRELALGAVGGYFRFCFGGPRGFTQRLLEHCIAWRCRLGTVYGDQGIFALSTAYHAAGGFAATPLFEEVPLVRGLRRRGRFVALPVPIQVDPRRWRTQGFWRRTFHNRMLALAFWLGVPTERLASWYRSK
jgi:rSAM/selenodomain-associated transferase 2